MKYLGFIIDESFNTVEHVKSKNKVLMRQTYSLYNTGLIGRTMDIQTKSFMYKVNCHPSYPYGLDLVNLEEKIIKVLRTDEAILLKRILVVPKWSSTTICYQVMKTRELIYFNNSENKIYLPHHIVILNRLISQNL